LALFGREPSIVFVSTKDSPVASKQSPRGRARGLLMWANSQGIYKIINVLGDGHR